MNFGLSDDLGSLVGNNPWQLMCVLRNDLVRLACNCTVKESCIQVISFCIHSQASCFIFVDKSESVVVNQVAGEVNPSVEVGFDICGTSLEPDFFVNQGKPHNGDRDPDLPAGRGNYHCGGE